jgi:N6-adenosine-specific RNA methylase IME4
MSIFQTVLADPPWRYQKANNMDTGTAEAHYPTMTTERVAELPVSAITAKNAHLYMWVTNPTMLGQRPKIMGDLNPEGICRAWGFEPMSMLTWVKTTKSGDLLRGGSGWYFRGATEHVIFAVKGNLPIPSADRVPNVFFAERRAHSEKPDVLYEIIEKASPGPYLEMFARRPRDGWLQWGNETEDSVDIHMLAQNQFLI